VATATRLMDRKPASPVCCIRHTLSIALSVDSCGYCGWSRAPDFTALCKNWHVQNIAYAAQIGGSLTARKGRRSVTNHSNIRKIKVYSHEDMGQRFGSAHVV